MLRVILAGILMLRMIATMLLLTVGSPAWCTSPWPHQGDGDFVIKDFHFETGEVLPDLKLHYVTMGTANRNAAGELINGVLLLHGTGGTAASWLVPSLADELFSPGAPLDAEKFYIIIPDGIGRGGSSKPSDGLRIRFPRYRYVDMIIATHRLLTEHLGVDHVRLVMGTSMGGMQTWMWGEMYPDFMDGLVPIASQPSEISGRNWISRRILIETIRNDPDWNGGDYVKKPTHWLSSAPSGSLMVGSPLHWQQLAASREAADALYRQMVAQASKLDANNVLYATEAVMDYNPSKDLEKIKAKLMAINSADDQINPAELGVVEPAIKRIRGARFVLLPASDKTNGHFTYFLAALWKQHLADFMKDLASPR